MTSANTRTMSTHHLEEISSGCGDRVSLSIRWNDARFVVNLDPSPAGNMMEDALIEEYNAVFEAEDYDEEEELSEKILDAVVEVGRPTFDRLAPPPAPGTAASTDLHTLLFPKEWTFRFRTRNGRTELTLRDDGPPDDIAPHAFHLRVDDTKLPRFSTKEISVIQKLLGDGYIAHVMAGGQEMCAKVGDDMRADSAQRELDSLLKISTCQVTGVLRVPRLLGLVQTPGDGRVIGVLEEYIPFRDTEELTSLGDIETPSSITKARRRKWASQVQETIHQLHQIGVTWGDGKARNVLIHGETDDAYIVDFGGGWTDGWLDQELSGTVEGDELAVKKIREFLEV